jgi:hypothetical protein
LSRHSRQDRRGLRDRLAADTERANEARQRCEQMADQVAQLGRDQPAMERFDAVEGWRPDEIPPLRDQIDHHWARVIGDCVKADDPLAFGIDKLRHARATTAIDLHNLDARIAADRSEECNEIRRQLPMVIRAKTRGRAGAFGQSRPAPRSRPSAVGTPLGRASPRPQPRRPWPDNDWSKRLQPRRP